MKVVGIASLFLGLFVMMSDAAGYGQQEPAARWCYSCAYSPPSPPKYGTGHGYGNDLGGWDKCLAPFDHKTARLEGIDLWLCHSNCYVRTDPNGNVFRGCFKDEYGVDQDKIGCNEQAGSNYCFCKDNACNTFEAPPKPTKKSY